MTSEKPVGETSQDDISAQSPDKLEPAQELTGKSSSAEEKDVWSEDYDEHISAEEPAPLKPKKKRKWGGVIVIAIILVFLVLWTVLSPKLIPQSGDTYLRSDEYSSLSGFAGDVETYAGNTTWAISVGGDANASVGVELDLSVLVTKVSERTSNFWFRGTGIELRNASIYYENGTFLAEMSDKSDIGFGPLATVPVTFAEADDCHLYAYVKFLVYADMRIGFLPVKLVEIESEVFTIHVS